MSKEQKHESIAFCLRWLADEIEQGKYDEVEYDIVGEIVEQNGLQVIGPKTVFKVTVAKA